MEEIINHRNFSRKSEKEDHFGERRVDIRLILKLIFRSREFSLLHSVQTGFGAHPASYPMGHGGDFPGG
jgi:hypothetical protein